jgi:hypothetical protein
MHIFAIGKKVFTLRFAHGIAKHKPIDFADY